MDKTSEKSFASFCDEDLVALAQKGDDRALDYLFGKYIPYVRNKSLSYFIAGADRDDIIQEGMIGLFKAVRDFSSERGVSFKTFADVCVTRQIITAVKNASRQKHAPLNFYISLNKSVADEDDDSTLADILGHSQNANPEEYNYISELANYLNDEQILDFADTLPSLFKTIEEWMTGFFNNMNNKLPFDLVAIKENAFNQVEEIGNSLYSSLPATILSVGKTLVSGFSTFLIGLVIGFFLLLSFDNMEETYIYLFTLGYSNYHNNVENHYFYNEEARQCYNKLIINLLNMTKI